MWIQIGVLEIEKIRVFEAFAGIGSQRMALHNLGIPHEVVGIAEIDKCAIQSYNAIWVNKTLILSIFWTLQPSHINRCMGWFSTVNNFIAFSPQNHVDTTIRLPKKYLFL